MEKQIDIQDELSLKLTYSAQRYLMTASKWAVFIGIMGFVLSGILAVGAVLVGGAASLIGGAHDALGALPGFGLIMIYLVIAGLYFILSYFIYSFGVKAKAAINTKNELLLEKSMSFLKQNLSFIGILIIVYLALIAIGVVVGIIFGVTNALSM